MRASLFLCCFILVMSTPKRTFGVLSCTSFILTFQSQGDGVWLLLVLGMSVCSPMNLHFDLYTVTGRHARFYTPGTAFYRDRYWSLDCKWAQSWERRHNGTFLEPRTSICSA